MQKLLSLAKLIAFVLVISYASGFAQGITSPRTASPAATVSQKIGISTVTVSYSRPAVKAREIWGALVPFGWNVQQFGGQKPAPWRAGANENTVITLSHDATIQDKQVPAGSYGLFFVINKDNTGELILSKDYRSWGSFWYDPAHDLARTTAEIRDHAMTEILTYDFINMDKNSAELVLNWEKKQFAVKIQFKVDDIVIANATEELKNTVGFSWQGYQSAANYALQNKVNTDLGLEWIEKAIQQNKSFGTLRTKSGLLRNAGREADADKALADAVAVSTEVELNNYGYQLINQKQVDKAIEMFTLNTQRFPKSANAWDSLGEAYATKGDKANAIKNFKKCLTLNPPEATKANSEKFLKQLEGK